LVSAADAAQAGGTPALPRETFVWVHGHGSRFRQSYGSPGQARGWRSI